MGRDKGKFNKRGGRGGASGFQATSAEEIEIRNSRIAEFDETRAKRRAEADEEEKEGGAAAEAAVEKGVSELVVGVNPNREDAPLTRKQREEADKERKAAEYRRRHELGLTEEFKRDMEKLNEVKRRREKAEKIEAAEKETTDALESERRAKAEVAIAAAAANDSDSDDEDAKKKSKKGKKKVALPKLDKIVIKKMKPAQLKDALKERGCEIQGNAKELTARLLAFEESR